MLFFAVSILSAAVVSFFIVQDRKEIAERLAEKAESDRQTAASVTRQEEIALSREKAVTQQHEAETKKHEAARAASEAATREAKAQEEVESKRLKAAEAEKEVAALKAKAAADARAEAEQKAVAARHEKETALARQKTSEIELAKAAELRAKSEADTLKLRYSLTELEQLKAEYANMISETKTLEAELEEMKRALTPEKTINDLLIVGEEADSSNKVARAEAANSALLTPGDRRLVSAERKRAEELASALASRRAASQKILERLLANAVAEKRVIDAQFYLNTLKALYPDWQQTKDTETK